MVFILTKFINLSLQFVLQVSKRCESASFKQVGWQIDFHKLWVNFDNTTYEKSVQEKYIWTIIFNFWLKEFVFLKQSFFRTKRSPIDAFGEITDRIGQESTDTFTCELLDLH